MPAVPALPVVPARPALPATDPPAPTAPPEPPVVPTAPAVPVVPAAPAGSEDPPPPDVDPPLPPPLLMMTLPPVADPPVVPLLPLVVPAVPEPPTAPFPAEPGPLLPALDDEPPAPGLPPGSAWPAHAQKAAASRVVNRRSPVLDRGAFALCMGASRFRDGVTVRAAHCAREPRKWLTRAEGHPHPARRTDAAGGAALHCVRVPSNLSHFRSWWTLAAESRRHLRGSPW